MSSPPKMPRWKKASLSLYIMQINHEVFESLTTGKQLSPAPAPVQSKGKADDKADVKGNGKTKEASDPKWAPDPDKPVDKQLQGQGQLKDLKNSPNTKKGVNMKELLTKTPRELEEMKRNGEIDEKTLKQIKKAFEGRDLGRRGKNK